MTSMLEYLASLRKHGHHPVQIGEVTIGRTVYAAGEFVNVTDGRSRIALMPMDTPRESGGRTPGFLPASYRRSSSTAYELNGAMWYISGWHTGRTNKFHAEDHDGVFWLDQLPPDAQRFGAAVMLATVHWRESFETSLALAGPEVRMRIRQLA